MSEQEVDEREKALRAEIKRVLPDFVNSCRDDTDVVIIHQDSFAADVLRQMKLLGSTMVSRVETYCGERECGFTREGYGCIRGASKEAKTEILANWRKWMPSQQAHFNEVQYVLLPAPWCF